MLVWRISKLRHAETAYSGEGARRFQGRWNPKGTPVVYTSTSRALAAVEFCVHLTVGVELEDLVMVEAQLPGSDPPVRLVEPAQLPTGWRVTMDYTVTNAIGAKWFRSRSSVAAMGPSAVIDGDWNVLLNPEHPVFSQVKIGPPEPYKFDPRLLRGIAF